MFNLIPISLLIISLGGIVYIASDHLSELNEDDDKNGEFSFHLRARFVNWVNRLPLDNVKSQSLSVTQKVLHRLRLFLLKSDNGLMRLIDKISKHDKSINGNGENNENHANFWEDISKNQEEKPIIPPAEESEVKIDFALKTETAKKYFDIKPAKISVEKSIRKTLKIKKHLNK